MIDLDTIEVEDVEIDSLSLHPLAKTTPGYTKEMLISLTQSIEEEGQSKAVTVYRNKIVDGRHRWLVLNSLGSKTIKIKRVPNNTSIKDLASEVRTTETRRQQTTAQLAIYALRQGVNIRAGGEKITNVELAAKFGTTVKELSRASKIGDGGKGKLNRPDILEELFQGGKIDIGDGYKPYPTNSMQTIINFLTSLKASQAKDITGIDEIIHFSNEDEIYINQVLNSIRKQSVLVKEEIVKRINVELKEEAQPLVP